MKPDVNARWCRRMLPVAPSSGVLLILLASLAGVVGCNSSENGTGDSEDPITNRPAPVFRADPQLCRDLLDRSIDMLQPERLGITADRKTAAGSLNDWALQCSGVEATSAEEIPDTAAGLVPDEMRQRISDPYYSGRDCDHVRNAFLFRRVLEITASGGGSDVEQVVEVFEHIVRTIHRVEREANEPPLTPFEIMVFGKGTAEDQAWVFAELLRQMQLDTVIVRPSVPDATEDGGTWFAGVLIDGNVYLFDFGIGLPVPAPDEDRQTLFVQTPATLEQAASEPTVLAALSIPGGAAYPVDAAALTEPRIELIGNSNVWSPRMKRLQTALAGEDAAVIHDPFWADGSNSGARARLVDAAHGRWDAADIGIWSYPETQLAAFAELDEQRPHDLHVWLKSPFPIIGIDQANQPTYGLPQNDLIKTRIDHILGNFASAIARYTGLRGLERALITGEDPRTGQTLVIPEAIRTELQQRVPPTYRRLHRLAAEDAHYWLGLAQYQHGQYAGAAGTWGSYLEGQGAGSWAAAASELRAVCLARDGRVDEAVAALRELLESKPDHPGRHGIELLIHRWEDLAAKAAPAGSPRP